MSTAKQKPRRENLSDDEIATAWFACAHASRFWRSRKKGGRYAKTEANRYDALSRKLDAILDNPTISKPKAGKK